MTEQFEAQTSMDSRGFVRKHWAAIAAMVAAASVATVGVIYVFAWFTGNAQSTGLVPSTLSAWSMNNLVTFVLYAVFWELAVVGIPVAISAIAGWQWWKRIPDAEKNQYNKGKGSRSSKAGGAISPLIFIAFAIKVYVDGNWNQAIASWNLDYVVGSMITILIWTVAIFAIPAIIGVIWWIRHK